MTGTAKEQLEYCILDQLSGWYADENCAEYRAITKHRKPGYVSFIMGYPSSNWGTAFALVTLHDDLVKAVQKSIMGQQEKNLETMLRKVQKFAVFRAVQRDEGGTFLWEINAETLSEDW